MMLDISLCNARPYSQNEMFNEIRDIDDGAGALFLRSGCDILSVLLGMIYNGINNK